jgi:hypothetical protein
MNSDARPLRFYNHPIAPISVSNEGAVGLDFSSTAAAASARKRRAIIHGNAFLTLL